VRNEPLVVGVAHVEQRDELGRASTALHLPNRPQDVFQFDDMARRFPVWQAVRTVTVGVGIGVFFLFLFRSRSRSLCFTFLFLLFLGTYQNQRLTRPRCSEYLLCLVCLELSLGYNLVASGTIHYTPSSFSSGSSVDIPRTLPVNKGQNSMDLYLGTPSSR
jgi:hypothetical protein